MIVIGWQYSKAPTEPETKKLAHLKDDFPEYAAPTKSIIKWWVGDLK